MLAGGVVTTLNPLYIVPEIEDQLRDSGARFLLVHPCGLEKALVAAASAAAMLYWSDTTGLPKGVLLTHRNLVAALCQVDKLLAFTASATSISPGAAR